MQNYQQNYALESIFELCMVPQCHVPNKVNKEGEKCKHPSQGTKHSVKIMCEVVFKKESDNSYWQSQMHHGKMTLLYFFLKKNLFYRIKL